MVILALARNHWEVIGGRFVEDIDLANRRAIACL